MNNRSSSRKKEDELPKPGLMFEFCSEEFGFAWIPVMVWLRQFHMLNVARISSRLAVVILVRLPVSNFL